MVQQGLYDICVCVCVCVVSKLIGGYSIIWFLKYCTIVYLTTYLFFFWIILRDPCSLYVHMTIFYIHKKKVKDCNT
ncbi:hypothetical protein F4703DRAFT_1890956 [Phycomyces blakesleeanus]